MSVLAASPRDFVARSVSDVMSPPVLALPGLWLVAWACGDSSCYWLALQYFALSIGLPLLYVVWLSRSGKVANLYLSNRHDRVRPFAASLVGGAAGLALLFRSGAPAALIAPVTALLVQALLLFLITLAWQVSIHTATVAGFVTYAVGLLGLIALPLIGLVPLMAWARLHLERHTRAQCIVGACVGAGCFFMLLVLRGVAW